MGGRAIELYFEFAVLRGDKTDVGDKKTTGNSPGGEPRLLRGVRWTVSSPSSRESAALFMEYQSYATSPIAYTGRGYWDSAIVTQSYIEKGRWRWKERMRGIPEWPSLFASPNSFEGSHCLLLTSRTIHGKIAPSMGTNPAERKPFSLLRYCVPALSILRFLGGAVELNHAMQIQYLGS